MKLAERKVHWVSRTKDKKTGEIAVSYSPKTTCPDTCSLKTGGCYAWGLFYLRRLGEKIDDGNIKIQSLQQALKKINPKSKVVRHRVAGDIVGDVPGTLEECHVVEKNGLINIGYTHDWRNPESQPLKKYFRASCQTEEEVLEARRMGWATTVIVSEETPKRALLSNGETAYMCPARHGVENKPDITCNTCTLCKVTDKTRDKTVMFQAHGNHATLKSLRGKIATGRVFNVKAKKKSGQGT